MVQRVSVRYELREGGTGEVVLAEVEPDVLSFRLGNGNTNRTSSRAVTLPIHASCNAGRSGSGIHSRGLLIAWTGDPPQGYERSGKLFIPVLRLFFFDISKLHNLATYKGSQCIIVGKRPEIIR